jgi:hypothetical protein
MVAQIDEQEIAVVALAVDPAGKADGLADMVAAQLAARVGTIGVHESGFPEAISGGKAHGAAPLVNPWGLALERGAEAV